MPSNSTGGDLQPGDIDHPDSGDAPDSAADCMSQAVDFKSKSVAIVAERLARLVATDRNGIETSMQIL